MRYLLSALVLCVTSLLVTPHASADEDDGYSKSGWPLAFVKRPAVIPQGMLEIRGDTLRMNLSKGAAFEPISLAPEVFYGIKKGWVLGVTHDTGMCLTGTDGGCPKAYNDVGVELQLSLMGRGSFQLAATGGASASSFTDPFVGGFNFGFLTRIRADDFAVVSHPRIYVGIVERDTRGDILDVPIDLLLSGASTDCCCYRDGVYRCAG